LYQGTNKGAIGTAIGTGFSNTNTIITSQGIIATNMQQDWYGPTQVEDTPTGIRQVRRS